VSKNGKAGHGSSPSAAYRLQLSTPINVGIVLTIFIWYVSAIDMAATATPAPNDVAPTTVVPRRQSRRFWSHAILFTACVILVNAVFGDKGLMETLRARKSYAAAGRELSRLKRENASLRDEVRRLRSDPATIEAVARGDLGLLRPGEILITVKDVR
jgi:cell division protein FtsB